MKTLILLSVCIVLAFQSVLAVGQSSIYGRIVDENGAPVAFATIVLMKNTQQITGTTAGDDGRFSLKAPTGNYTMIIEFVGYTAIEQQIAIDGVKDLGTFTLKMSATEIESVVVTSHVIKREADRFVVDVANSTAAIGKDGIEMLEHTPGVWVSQDNISINGSSGVKVYINDRELKMEITQLISYLRGLKAENIQKIEVIPATGADYDADSTGGIIKITLKRQRENGLSGSTSLMTAQSDLYSLYDPSAQISFMRNKFTFNALAWGLFSSGNMDSKENTSYNNSSSQLTAVSDMSERRNYGGAEFSGVYEINERHSVGAEISFMSSGDRINNDSQTDFVTSGITTNNTSHYNTYEQQRNYGAAFNYIYKIDTIGSTLKFLADYSRRNKNNDDDYFTRSGTGVILSDSTYRDNTRSIYNITSATLALEKVMSPKWRLKAGLKYTNNDMNNSALYEYLKEEVWRRNDNHSFDMNYVENIGAAYAAANSKIGRWGMVLGLRGEYTYASGKGQYVTQNYFSLFPNANISFSLDKEGKHSLIASYARTISRPAFWILNPMRIQISDYTYQIGNPSLKPSFSNDVSLTMVLKYKYSISAGVKIETDGVQMNIHSDSENPNIMFMTWDNFNNVEQYYITVNLPFLLTKWWNMSIDITGIRQGLRPGKESEEQFDNMLRGNAMMSFTLPRKFFIDLSYRGSSTMVSGNFKIQPTHNVDISIKKRLCNDRLTLSLAARNIFRQPQIVVASSAEYTRRVEMRQPWNNYDFRIGITYNFKSGKSFRNKSIETSSAEDKSRL